MDILTEQILENYEQVTKDLVKSEDSIKDIFEQTTLFKRYIDQLASPLLEYDHDAYNQFIKIATHERNMILQETEMVNDGKALL